MKQLEGKVAIVTGASKGIGAAIAKALASEGASVVVNYASSKEGAETVVSAIVGQGGQAIAVGGDVSKKAEVESLINAAVNAYGKLDVLVNNAAIYNWGPIEAITEDNFHKQFNINVLGLLLTTQAALPHMSAGGSIINISSVVTSVTPPHLAVYSGTKGAVDAINGVLAKELGSRQIRVNTISPGMVETEGSRELGVIGSDMEKQMIAQTPLGRTGQPDDIADVAVFLASDASRWMTGEKLVVSGGMH